MKTGKERGFQYGENRERAPAQSGRCRRALSVSVVGERCRRALSALSARGGVSGFCVRDARRREQEGRGRVFPQAVVCGKHRKGHDCERARGRCVGVGAFKEARRETLHAPLPDPRCQGRRLVVFLVHGERHRTARRYQFERRQKKTTKRSAKHWTSESAL